MALQHLEKLRDFTCDPGIAGGPRAVLLGPDQRHEIVAAGHEVGQPGAVGVGGRGGRKFQRPAHPGQHLGIDAVGLGQPARRTRILPRLPGVDAGAVDLCVSQGFGQRALVAARGFDDDKGAFRRAGKAGKRLFRHENPFVLPGREGIGVDPAFGDIDADDVLWQGHGACP